MTGKVDLHTHSTYSDGSLTPRELLDLARCANITMFAITDHDEITGSKELMRYTNEGVYLYSGIELTAQVDRGRMHILGYNIDLDNERLNKKVIEMKGYSFYNILLYVQVLKRDYGIHLPTKDIEDIFSKEGNVGRPELALLLMKYGYVNSVDEAFDRFLTPAYNKVRRLKKGVSEEECLDLISSAGGIASLAHPSSLKLTPIELDRRIAYLKSCGLGSIEVYHINNSPEERDFYLELAEKYDLLVSGGTDFHGEVKPDVKIGTGRNGNVDINEHTLTLTKNIKSRYMK